MRSGANVAGCDLAVPEPHRGQERDAVVGRFARLWVPFFRLSGRAAHRRPVRLDLDRRDVADIHTIVQLNSQINGSLRVYL